MKVELLNKEECKNFFKTWGTFACTCYNTDSEYAERVGKSCFKTGHYSGSRSFSFVFNIKGISRACSHQLVRHSVGVTINQKSQRYCNEDDFEYVVPPEIEKDKNILGYYENCMKHIQLMYSGLKEQLNAKGLNGESLNQDARYVLPNACTTELTIGFTLEALIHFCEERLCSASQWEIRELAKAIRKEIIDILPELSEKLNPKCINLGYCTESEKRCCGIRPNKNKIKIIELEEKE